MFRTGKSQHPRSVSVFENASFKTRSGAEFMFTKQHQQKLFQGLLRPQSYLNAVWFPLVLLETILSLLVNSLLETVFIL